MSGEEASIVTKGAVIISATVTFDGSAAPATILSTKSRSVSIPKGKPSLLAINEPIRFSTINLAASRALALESIEMIVRMIWRTVISDVNFVPLRLTG